MGIYEVFAPVVDGIANRTAIPLGYVPKYMNWQRQEFPPSGNWMKAGHVLDLVNALNGHPSDRSLEQNIAWWEWELTETPLYNGEDQTRVYAGSHLIPEAIVAALADFEPALERLREPGRRRMKAWIGNLAPASVNRPGRARTTGGTGEPGLIVCAGEPLAYAGLQWVGIGHRSIDLVGDDVAFLQGAIVGQFLAIVLGFEIVRQLDHGGPIAVERALSIRRFARNDRPGFQRLDPPDLVLARAAVQGDPKACAEVWKWQELVPLPNDEATVGRTAPDNAWSVFWHCHDSSTAGGCAASSEPRLDQFLSPFTGQRETPKSEDWVGPATAAVRDLGNGIREVVCWRDETPGTTYALRMPTGEDTFRASVGPQGVRVDIPKADAPPDPPPTPQPHDDGGGTKQQTEPSQWKKLLPLVAILALVLLIRACG